ncbi:MAG: hypothetical protein U0529_07595 [Thermoanaerobaculia bacterium]
MIAFVTLFLGLVHGTVPLRLAAAEGVAVVEIYLDDERVLDVYGPPFEAALDLGPEIVPREVVAVARARDGRRLGEVRQWINRPRPGAEASFLLERDRSGRTVSARLLWRRISGAPLSAARVFFDGTPLEAPDLERIAIPRHAPEIAHFLLADVDFADGGSATAVASFGGVNRGKAERELTGLPVRVVGRAPVPPPDRLSGWFESGSRPLPVAAVEEGPAEVGFVLAGNARDDLARLDSEDRWPWPWSNPRPIDLPQGARFRFSGTEPRTVSEAGETVRLFPACGEFTPKDGRFLRLGAGAALERPPAAPAIAEAVAVSALASAGRERRRAVVLLLGEGATEMGRLDAARVRRYLSRLRVPLFVWRISKEGAPAAEDWPGVVDASTVPQLREAFHALRSELASQRIVWVEGRIEPSRIGLSSRATAFVEAR